MKNKNYHPIGIGLPITEELSHTSRHTDRVPQGGSDDLGTRAGGIQFEFMTEIPILKCYYHPFDLSHPPLAFPRVTRFDRVVLIDASLK